MIGGATVQVLNLIRGLHRIKVKVVVVVDDAKTIKHRYIKFTDGSGAPSFLLDRISNIKINRLLRLNKAIKDSNSPWVYQAGSGIITFVSLLFMIINKKYFIHRVANDADLDIRIFKRLGFIKGLVFIISLKFSHLVLCQNQYQYNRLLSFIPKNKIAVIKNPIDIKWKTRINDNYKYPGYIAWVGIFQYQKNLPLLLEIVKNNPELNFKIAGKKKTNIDSSTLDAINELKAQTNIEFVGYLTRKQIHLFLEKASVLLNTSHYEGFSNTYLEALAALTPVVCKYETDPDLFIKSNLFGYTAKNVDEFSYALKKAIIFKSNPSFRSHVLDYLHKNHDPKNIAQKIFEIIKVRY